MTYGKDELIEMICRTCEFYREDDRDYECAAFKILRSLLEKGEVTAEEVRAVRPG